MMMLVCAWGDHILFSFFLSSHNAIVCYDNVDDFEYEEFNIPHTDTFSFDLFFNEMPYIHRGGAGYMRSKSFMSLDSGHFAYAILLMIKYYALKYVFIYGYRGYRYIFSTQLVNFRRSFTNFKNEQRKKLK